MAGAAFPTPPTGEPPASPAGGWSVGAGRGATWWSDGWHLFRAAPGMWVLLVVVFAALCMATSFSPVGAQVAGLVYPVLATGLVIGARDVERGEPLRFGH